MMVLLAFGIGLGVMGLVAIAIAVPISDSSFGNGLLISGVIVACTGFLLGGLWLAVRDMKRALTGTPARDVEVRPAAAKAKPSPNPLFPPNPGQAASAARGDIASPESVDALPPAGPAEPPPWAEEAASRGRARPAAPEVVVPPADPVMEEPAAPPQPERPVRRNLLFSIKRRDKSEAETEAAPVPRTALEAEPGTSFENAWPQFPRAEAEPRRAEAAPEVRPPDAEPEVSTPMADGLTVVKSGVVDGMSYTLFSDGSIEARLSGEDPIRFGSLDALRTYLDQRQ